MPWASLTDYSKTQDLTMRILYSLLIFVCFASLSAQSALEMEVIGTYNSGIFDDGAIEIVTYNAADQKLYAVNGATGAVDIFSIADPTNIERIDSILLSDFGDKANSVAFYNGVLAVAVEADDFDAAGMAVFFDGDGMFLSQVTVGVLPDMITWSPDGQFVITANEGEPDDDYTDDPMGTISVIDMSGGAANLTQANVTTLDFTNFDSDYDPAIRVFGPEGNILAEDFQSDTVDMPFTSFTTFSVSSDRDWQVDDFGDDIFAEANGFGGDGPSDDWLLTPTLDMSALASASFSFENTRNFSGGDLQVLVSVDYAGGDPSAANWVDLSDMAIFSEGGFADTLSGEINVTPYISASTTFAFRYLSDGGAPGEGALWQIDDVKVSAPALLPSRNLEPEYVTVSPDGKTAYVSCQENNALAVVDLETISIAGLVPLGFKDHSLEGNGFDASNEADAVAIQPWPTLGMYQPDALATVEVGGETYVLSANEGDARDYDAYSEEDRVRDLVLDSLAYPNADTLQADDQLGRLNTTLANGDTDGDGDYDQIYSYGARSFSVWNAAGELVFDSGDDFAEIINSQYPDNFNSTNDDNDSFKNRSDDKGSEPEAVIVAELNGNLLAFIALERMGGIMVYDINDPTDPQFLTYYLNRDFSADAETPEAGDLGPEGLVFISADESPNGMPLLVTANEVSGTLSIYQIDGNIVSTEDFAGRAPLRVYPNPVRETINFSEVTEGTLFDLHGRPLRQINGQRIPVGDLPAGLYVYRDQNNGRSVQILKQ